MTPGRAGLERLLHRLFETGLIFKGVFAGFELASGLTLFLLGDGQLFRMVQRLTAVEISQDPKDLVATYLLSATRSLPLETQHFYALYLASHGAIKLAVVAALAMGLLRAFPLAIAIFAGFVVYQVHLLILGPTAGIALITVVDLGVIWLTWHEYQALKRAAAGNRD